jgi:hypothetical protein
MPEECHQHFDDIVVGVVVVIEKNHVVLRNEGRCGSNDLLGFYVGFRRGFDTHAEKKDSLTSTSYKVKQLNATSVLRYPTLG